MVHESCILCDKLNTFFKTLQNSEWTKPKSKRKMMIEKCILHKPDNRFFFETQKISLNSGHFYVVLMILFLSARKLFFSLSFFIVFYGYVYTFCKNRWSFESWHLSRVIYVVLRNDLLSRRSLVTFVSLLAAVSHENA